MLPVLLLGIAGVSVAPLAGPRTGWAYFYREHMHSQYLSDLTLDDWTHYIKVGYYRVQSLSSSSTLLATLANCQHRAVLHQKIPSMDALQAAACSVLLRMRQPFTLVSDGSSVRGFPAEGFVMLKGL